MKEQMYKKLYKTKDFPLACTIYELGGKIDSTEWDYDQCYFVFEDEEKCLEFEVKYVRNELKVNPRTYNESMKVIKSFLYK